MAMATTVAELITLLSRYPQDAVVLTETVDGKGTLRAIDASDTSFDVIKDYPWNPQDWNWTEKTHLMGPEKGVLKKATYICIK